MRSSPVGQGGEEAEEDEKHVKDEKLVLGDFNNHFDGAGGRPRRCSVYCLEWIVLVQISISLWS